MAREHGDDQLPRHLRAPRHLHGRPGDRARGDPDHDPLLAAEPPRRRRRRRRSSTWTISSSRSVRSTFGTKPAPIPWILCGPGAPPESTGESVGSTATARNAGFRALRASATPGDRAAGPHAGHDHVHAAVGVVPDLDRGRLAVDLRVRRVLELPDDHRVRGSRCCSSSARAIAPFIPFAPSVSTTRAPERLEDLAALDRHRVGHGEDQPDAPGRADEGQRDPGVARGRLDHGGHAGPDGAALAARPRSSSSRCGP